MLGNQLLSKTIDKHILKYIILFSIFITVFLFYQSTLSVVNITKLIIIIGLVGIFMFSDYKTADLHNEKLKEFGKDFKISELLNNTDIMSFLERKKYIKDINKNTYFDIIKRCTYFIKAYKLCEIDKENSKQYYDCANGEKNEIINLLSSISITKVRYDHYSKEPDYEIIGKDIDEITKILNNYLRKMGLYSIDTWEEGPNYLKQPFFNEKVQPRDKYNLKSNII